MQQLRLSLLLICLFSLAGGCVASSSHGVVVPKIVWSSGKQQPAREAAVKLYPSGKEMSAVFFEADDIEDDENLDCLSFRKSKMPLRYDLTGTHHSITLNSLRCCRLTVATMLGHSAPRYIAQQVFRV